ncbi:MAG: ornithine carbamoyltransferase [Gammaproteobacteria bacterium]
MTDPAPGAARHFLRLGDLTPAEHSGLIERGIALKAMRRARAVHEPLKNRVLAMLFEKASTRTRVSFEAAIAELGGHAMFLSPHDTQMGRGEPIEDTARVISRMVDGIMIRTYAHDAIERFARYSVVPVINGLTDRYHPCQLLADMQTYAEHRGAIAGRQVAWIGDGNNMCHSYIEAALLYGFELRLACPAAFSPHPEAFAGAGTAVSQHRDPRAAAEGADLVVTDVWASMGQEQEGAARREAFAGYQVDAALMRLARPDALFMHCLPAHRGEEVSAAVLEGPQSVVWDAAENRLHAQKALLERLLA